MLKEPKETMVKEVKETRMMSYQIENNNTEIKTANTK